jgi:hypothetical protein
MLLLAILVVHHSAPVSEAKKNSQGVAEFESSRSYFSWLKGDFEERWRTPAGLSGIESVFADLWERAVIIEEWWMDCTAWQWERFNASSPTETDLLEARFHVATAEVFADAMTQEGRARTELTRAETSLDAARATASPHLDRQLLTVSEEIATVELQEQAEETLSTERFEAIKADLDHLVAMLRSSIT